MPTNFIEPFDFGTIFLNYFLGSQSLFYYFLMIILSFACASMEIPNELYFILLAAGSIMLGAYIGESVYVFTLFIVVFVSFYIFNKIFK